MVFCSSSRQESVEAMVPTQWGLCIRRGTPGVPSYLTTVGEVR